MHSLPAGNEAGLVASYRLDGSDGSVISDIAGNADGTFIGTGALPVTPTFIDTNPLIVAEDGELNGTIIATDVEGDSLSITLDADGANGSVIVTDNGDGTASWTYTPDDEYSGFDSFSVLVDDGLGGVTTRTIDVEVTAVNDAPVLLGARSNVAAVQFDGVDDFIEVVDPAALLPDNAGDPFTFETWVQVASGATFQPIASLGTNSGLTGLEIGIDGSGNLTAFSADGTATAVSAAAVNDGAWHHVAVTYDGANLQTYVDGQASGAPTPVALDLTAGEITFAQSIDDTTFFKGAVDDIRFWSDARTPDEIAENYQLADIQGGTANLEARYILDNVLTDNDDVDDDPSLVDVTGNGHEVGAGGPPNNRFEDYLVLDGTGDYASFTDFNAIDGTGNVTIEAWVNPNDLSGRQTIIDMGGTNLLLVDNSIRLEIGGSGVPSTSTGVITAGD